MSTATAKKSPVPAKPDKPAAPATHLIFVYGTLKKGFYNNDYWLKNGKFIANDSIGGHVMINLGPYPAIAKIDGPFAHDNFGVTGELWEVDENDFGPIKRMEEGAGYTTSTVLTDGGKRAEVFIMHDFKQGEYTWSSDKTVAVTTREKIPF